MVNLEKFNISSEARQELFKTSSNVSSPLVPYSTVTKQIEKQLRFLFGAF